MSFLCHTVYLSCPVNNPVFSGARHFVIPGNPVPHPVGLSHLKYPGFSRPI